MNGVSIEPARNDDWPWMLEGIFQGAWETIGPVYQKTVDKEKVKSAVKVLVEQMRGPKSLKNEALIAKGLDGENLGCVWIGVKENPLASLTQALVLDLYVDEAARGQGLGRRLMRTAEEWAKAEGLSLVTLNVGVHNSIARRLYHSLGYEVSVERFAKEPEGSFPAASSGEISWDIVLAGMEKTAIELLGPTLREMANHEQVRAGVKKQVRRFRETLGERSRLLFENGSFVWVRESRNVFTGRMEGFITGISPEGNDDMLRRLVRQAEGWAAGKGHQLIAMPVSADSLRLRGLLLELGFKSDMVQMTKMI